MHKWQIASLLGSDDVEACLLITLADKGILHLLSANSNVVTWLRDVAMKELAK